jgi:hypothetical protein
MSLPKYRHVPEKYTIISEEIEIRRNREKATHNGNALIYKIMYNIQANGERSSIWSGDME